MRRKNSSWFHNIIFYAAMFVLASILRLQNTLDNVLVRTVVQILLFLLPCGELGHFKLCSRIALTDCDVGHFMQIWKHAIIYTLRLSEITIHQHCANNNIIFSVKYPAFQTFVQVWNHQTAIRNCNSFQMAKLEQCDISFERDETPVLGQVKQSPLYGQRTVMRTLKIVLWHK